MLVYAIFHYVLMQIVITFLQKQCTNKWQEQKIAVMKHIVMTLKCIFQIAAEHSSF